MSAPRRPAAGPSPQQSATDPRQSVWVSASAGTGKTKVLTDRVLRLLLQGTPPTRLLCLTFTKAAAAEMMTRVVDSLSAWATVSSSPKASVCACARAHIKNRRRSRSPTKAT